MGLVHVLAAEVYLGNVDPGCDVTILFPKLLIPIIENIAFSVLFDDLLGIKLFSKHSSLYKRHIKLTIHVNRLAVVILDVRFGQIGLSNELLFEALFNKAMNDFLQIVVRLFGVGLLVNLKIERTRLRRIDVIGSLHPLEIKLELFSSQHDLKFVL